MSHFRNTSNCILSFRKINTEAPVISKRLKFPQDERTDTNFIAPLRMHFQTSKRYSRQPKMCYQCIMEGVPDTMDSQRQVFVSYRRKGQSRVILASLAHQMILLIFTHSQKNSKKDSQKQLTNSRPFRVNTKSH